MRLHEAVKTARLERGLTHREAAALVGVDRSYVVHIGAGRRVPSLGVWLRLRRELGVHEPDQLA
jgi:DNA-binding XRE family transcriptional regulator